MKITKLSNGGLVETWYSKQDRSYVTQIKDSDGNQVGEAMYDGTKADSKIAHAWSISLVNKQIPKEAQEHFDRVEQQKQEMRKTAVGKLLVRYGFEPYDTESSARRVAEKASAEILELKQEVKRLKAALKTSQQ